MTIEGYQAIADHETCQAGDWVKTDSGGFLATEDQIGQNAVHLRKSYGERIYRKIPVAKQGDLDDNKWSNSPIHDKILAFEAKQKAIPADAADRKNLPIVTGCLDYFPLALLEVAKVSKVGNDQHNPGQPLHWDRSKSTDEADACIRHFLQRGTKDIDGMRHTAKAAWRMLALLEKELENEKR